MHYLTPINNVEKATGTRANRIKKANITQPLLISASANITPANTIVSRASNCTSNIKIPLLQSRPVVSVPIVRNYLK